MSGTLASYQIPITPIENPILLADGTFAGPGNPVYDNQVKLNEAHVDPAPPTLNYLQPATQPQNLVVEAPASNGVIQLDQALTSQNAATIPISRLTVQGNSLTFIPSPDDPNSGTILVPDSGALYQVPANTFGTVGQGSYAPVIPNTQMGVFNLQNPNYG